ncbi:MAG: PH domain-containing protein [Candidatus Micrarchaeia archaeon]
MRKISKNQTSNGEPTCHAYPLVRAKIVKKTIAGMISLLSAVALSLLFFSSIILPLAGPGRSAGLFLLSMGACALILYMYETAHFNRYYYDLAQKYLVIKEGVFTYGETSMPYARIQDVFVDQDILDQIFGLYDLHVATASGQSSLNAHIDGLSYEGAEAIKERLLELMSKKSK